MAGADYALPAGAEKAIERRLIETLPLALGSDRLRLYLVVRRVIGEFPELADWPVVEVLIPMVQHIDGHLMAGLRQRTERFRLAGEGDDRPVVNDLLRGDEEDAR